MTALVASGTDGVLGDQDRRGWLSSLFEWFSDSVGRVTRSDLNAIDHLCLYGAQTFGDRVLDAVDRADMDEALEELAYDREFLAFLDYLRPQILQEGRNRPTDRAIRAITQVIGNGFEPKVREFARLVQFSVSALDHMPPALPMPHRLLAGMADRLYDLATPAAYIECIVGELRVDAAQLALLRGVMTGRLEAWQAHSLMDFSCEGVRTHLALVAEFGDIPADVVPPAKRISWWRMVEEWDRLAEKIGEIEKAAEAAGTPFFPFGGPPDAD